MLAVLVVGLSVLSQFITNRQQKKSGQIMENTGMGTMKAMMFVMPVMLAVFALTSNSAFSVHDSEFGSQSFDKPHYLSYRRSNR